MNRHASGGTSATSPTRKTVDVVTAGRMLGIGRSLAYQAAARGDIPTIRIGGRVLVPLGRLERLLEGDE